MSHACTPVLVGVTLPVSEIWLPFKNKCTPILVGGASLVSEILLFKKKQPKSIMDHGLL